ncbi:MAG: M13 family metallopeptidase N-terminal domain-containing protein, partial [Gemmatimonadaceae bacterium]
MVQHSSLTRARVATALAVAILVAPSAAGAQKLTSGIDTTNFDRSIRPQDDFFRFVNGGWLKKTEIKGDATGAGAFQELADRSRNGLHELFEEAARPEKPLGDQRAAAKLHSPNGPTEAERHKIGDLYASYMDTARIERLGIAPIA